MKNGVVIVGAGHAGVQAAASLREDGYGGPVILVGDENELPYHKPPLSKTFIKDAEAKPQPLRGEAFIPATPSTTGRASGSTVSIPAAAAWTLPAAARLPSTI